MADEFPRSLAKVLVHEGGYSNNPKDPGGATMQGITQRVYDTYRASKKLDSRPVKLIDASERDDIYRSRYWDAIKGDELPAGVSYVVFDGAVNSGVAQSVKWLQRALNVTADGVIGPATLQAVVANQNNDALVVQICARRLAFLKALKTWSGFGAGWTARVADVSSVGQAWATGAVGQDVSYAVGGEAKGQLSDAKSVPVLAVADASSGGGIGGLGLTGYLASAKDQLTQFAGNHFVDNALIGLTVTSLALVGGGAAYRWYAARKRAELADALDLQAKVPA